MKRRLPHLLEMKIIMLSMYSIKDDICEIKFWMKFRLRSDLMFSRSGKPLAASQKKVKLKRSNNWLLDILVRDLPKSYVVYSWVQENWFGFPFFPSDLDERILKQQQEEEERKRQRRERKKEKKVSSIGLLNINVCGITRCRKSLWSEFERHLLFYYSQFVQLLQWLKSFDTRVLISSFLGMLLY